MKYRKLGQTGLQVSTIGLGTWQFSGEWGKDFTQRDVDTIMKTAKDEGINFIDTAECYGDHTSEEFIGDYIKSDREHWILGTKFGHIFHSMTNREKDYTAQGMITQLDASLKALQTDYIDLYQFHSGPNEALIDDDLWTALDKQVQAGKIRHLGVSIGKGFDHEQQIQLSSELNVTAIQLEYNRLSRKPEESALPLCQQHDYGVLARVPLASGYLSGKYKPGTTFSGHDVRVHHNQEHVQDMLTQVEQIAKEEVPDGVNMSQWALAWCLQHPAVTTVIPGAKNVEQVISNARASELTDSVNDSHPQAL